MFAAFCCRVSSYLVICAAEHGHGITLTERLIQIHWQWNNWCMTLQTCKTEYYAGEILIKYVHVHKSSSCKTQARAVNLIDYFGCFWSKDLPLEQITMVDLQSWSNFLSVLFCDALKVVIHHRNRIHLEVNVRTSYKTVSAVVEVSLSHCVIINDLVSFFGLIIVQLIYSVFDRQIPHSL